MKNDKHSKDTPTAGSPKSSSNTRCRSSDSQRRETKQSWSSCFCESVSSVARLGRYLLLALMLTVLILSGFYYWMNIENPVSTFIHPSLRTDQTNLWKTPTGVGGLHLTIENNLNLRWTRYLEEYVIGWNAGYDAIIPLSLQVERVEFDPLCKPSLGKLKVCNGNYGDTGWRGINIALTDKDNRIQHSVIQFNDYYAENDDKSRNPWKVIKYSDFWGQMDGESQLKYTMCHELGHGFGLAHSDE